MHFLLVILHNIVTWSAMFLYCVMLRLVGVGVLSYFQYICGLSVISPKLEYFICSVYVTMLWSLLWTYFKRTVSLTPSSKTVLYYNFVHLYKKLWIVLEPLYVSIWNTLVWKLFPDAIVEVVKTLFTLVMEMFN